MMELVVFRASSYQRIVPYPDGSHSTTTLPGPLAGYDLSPGVRDHQRRTGHRNLLAVGTSSWKTREESYLKFSVKHGVHGVLGEDIEESSGK